MVDFFSERELQTNQKKKRVDHLTEGNKRISREREDLLENMEIVLSLKTTSFKK